MRNKKLSLITLAIATAAVVFFASANLYTYAGDLAIINSNGSSSQQSGIEKELSRITIPVEGMTCFTCE
ncbi:MAG: hypothetical protein GWN30_32675, partial [Gammaproteobacteria bacterium]|nr:hypothetical protein [Gammaproteobacteria bacterium]NIW99459.1 hypothetical protein [Phycisphaerae bacterium]